MPFDKLSNKLEQLLLLFSDPFHSGNPYMVYITILLAILCTTFALFYYRGKLKTHLLEIENATLKTTIEANTAAYEAEKKLYYKGEEALKEAFQSLSLDALRKNNESFLDLAKKSFDALHEKSDGNLSKREETIRHLVKPMKESLSKLDEHLHEVRKENKAESSTLKEHIKTLIESEAKLKAETASLVKVLKAPDVRGRWGEVQLKRVVELAGMLGHCDFFEQKTYEQEEGRQRPDMIVQMPGGRCIAIDAKAPFDAFLEASQSQNDREREEKIKLHAKQLRNHILALAKKSYFKNFTHSPEFVVLFLPNESFYTTALTTDPSLLELGADRGVIIATPSTLIGLLKAVAFGWKQDQISKNAEEVSRLGHELYKRLSDMNQHMGQLGRNLKSATQTYNRAVGSFESRVLVSARKLKELGAGAHEIELNSPDFVETIPKELRDVL